MKEPSQSLSRSHKQAFTSTCASPTLHCFSASLHVSIIQTSYFSKHRTKGYVNAISRTQLKEVLNKSTCVQSFLLQFHI